MPLLGLTAAFVFAAQMINFPVAGGTSGHLIGAVLTAALLGPSAAVVVISAVLIVQCLMFADGGLSALGANVFNMGVLGGVGGWAIYHAVSRAVKGLFGRVLAAAFAAWCSTVLASVACAGELAASGTVAWSVALPAMAGVHMLIGVGEGLITALVLAAIARARPELLAPGGDRDVVSPVGRVRRLDRPGAGALRVAPGLPLAGRPGPDGRVLGFAEKAAAPVLAAPMPDYEMPGIPGRPRHGAGRRGRDGRRLRPGLAPGAGPGAEEQAAVAAGDMEHDFLDRYSRLSSPVHRLPARRSSSRPWRSWCSWPRCPGRIGLAPGAAVLLLAVAGLARLPWRSSPADAPRRAVRAGRGGAGAAPAGGWRLFLFLVAKSTLCLLTMVLLANTTPFAELLRVLKAARVPALLVTTLSLMYRYLFVLVDESQRMRRARLSRTFTGRQARSWRTRATVLGQLFIRASERAERIYGAMCARGWR